MKAKLHNCKSFTYLGTVRDVLESQNISLDQDRLQKVFLTEAWTETLECPVYRIIPRRRTAIAGRFRVGYDKASRRYTPKSIILHDRLFTHGCAPDIRDTFLHEVAHCFTVSYYQKDCGHDRRWQMIARALGDDGGRCHSYSYLTVKRQERSYSYVCINILCGAESSSVRDLKHPIETYFCRRCKSPIKRTGKGALLHEETERRQKVMDQLVKDIGF